MLIASFKLKVFNVFWNRIQHYPVFKFEKGVCMTFFFEETFRYLASFWQTTLSVYIFHVNTYKGINQFDISHVHLLKWFFYQMIIETQSSSNTQENDFSFGWHDSMVKDIMARRTSDNEVKKSFVFFPQ